MMESYTYINIYVDNIINKYLDQNIFIKNKEFFKYINIIKKALNENRTKDKFCHETHHIIPISFKENKPNCNNNKVILKFEEHFLVHKYLPYFTTNIYRVKMLYAFKLLSIRYKNEAIDENEYKILKEALIKHKADTYIKEKHPWFGKKHTPESIEKIRQASRDRPSGMLGKKNCRSEEGKKSFNKKTSGENNSSKRPEVRLKLSISKLGSKNPMYGKDFSPEHRKKISEKSSGDKNPSKLPGVGKKISEAKKDKTKYNWFHEKYGHEYLSRHELAEKYPEISINKLSDVIKNRNISHRNWKIIK